MTNISYSLIVKVVENYYLNKINIEMKTKINNNLTDTKLTVLEELNSVLEVLLF